MQSITTIEFNQTRQNLVKYNNENTTVNAFINERRDCKNSRKTSPINEFMWMMEISR